MKPERLGFDIEIEIVAEALSGFRWQIVAVGLRRAEQAETHGLWLISFRPTDRRQFTYLEQQQLLRSVAHHIIVETNQRRCEQYNPVACCSTEMNKRSHIFQKFNFHWS